MTLGFGYVLAKIDVQKAVQVIRDADRIWIAISALLILLNIPPMAWRWQLLLRARGIAERFVWLVRTYCVSFAIGQVLPTSVGGDASRIFETTRRHPGRLSAVTGSVLVERALGGATTILLAAIGFVFAIGRYEVSSYLWIEAVFALGAAAIGVVFFSKAARVPLRRLGIPLVRRMRLEQFARAVYDGVHGYRGHIPTLLVVTAATLSVQISGILSIYAAAARSA